MSDTIDRQLEHLAALHAEGALTDDEFAAAKANALGPAPAPPTAPPTTPPTTGPILTTPRPAKESRLVVVLLVVAAVTIGISATGFGVGFEWAPIQAPAAPIVCPGGDFVAGYDVSYTVATKGVDIASVCMKDGQVRDVSGWWLGVVLAIEYSAIVFVALYAWRWLYLRRNARRPSIVPGLGGGFPDA